MPRLVHAFTSRLLALLPFGGEGRFAGAVARFVDGAYAPPAQAGSRFLGAVQLAIFELKKIVKREPSG